MDIYKYICKYIYIDAYICQGLGFKGWEVHESHLEGRAQLFARFMRVLSCHPPSLLGIYLSIYLSNYIYIYLSIYLSIYLVMRTSSQLRDAS